MSLKLYWPVKNSFITQGFGERPGYYAQFGLPGHEGIDFQAIEGTEVYAAGDGVVVDAMPEDEAPPASKSYGNYVRIQHDEGYVSIYAHLSQLIAARNQTVRVGDLIGLSGNTGNSQGAHLHLALKKPGASQRGETRYPWDFVDPTPFLVGGSLPSGNATPPVAPAQPATQVQVNSPAVGYINLRSAPTAVSAPLAQPPDKTLLDVLEVADSARAKIGQIGQWIRVRTSEGLEGYVAAWYIKLSDSAPAPAPVPAPIGEPPALSVIVVSPAEPLKVRSDVGTQFAILALAPDGVTLVALESADVVRAKIGQPGQWLHVKTSDGVTGYCAAWYVKLA
jgi:hypothetical protein